MNIKLIVTNILGDSINGYSRVTVSNEVFASVKGLRPAMPHTAQADQSGRGVRIFNFDGINLYSRYDKETFKTTFIMKTEDAKKALVPVEALSFNTTQFNVVATA